MSLYSSCRSLPASGHMALYRHLLVSKRHCNRKVYHIAVFVQFQCLQVCES